MPGPRIREGADATLGPSEAGPCTSRAGRVDQGTTSVTYIPAETDPQHGRQDDAPYRGQHHQPPLEHPEGRPTQLLPAAPPRAAQPGTARMHVPTQPAPLQRPWAPHRIDDRRDYPGQAAYQYGGVQDPDRRRDLSLGIAVGQLVRAGVLFGLAALVAWTALRTVNGQWVDEIALQQAGAVRDRLPASMTGLLSSATLIICLAAGVIAVVLAASNGRWIPLLVAAGTSVPALASVQLLKHGLLDKTAYGIQESAQNSLPSGHTAAAAAAVAAVVLVAPARQRKLWALLGTVAITVAGVGTVINGWHRPADAVVSVLLIAGWFVLGSLVLRALIPAEPWVPQRGLTLLGLLLVSAALTALAMTAQQTVPAPGLALAFGALSVLSLSLLSAHQMVRAMRPRRR